MEKTRFEKTPHSESRGRQVKGELVEREREEKRVEGGREAGEKGWRRGRERRVS